MSDLVNQPSGHEEPHLSFRTGWLRAAVMGANDGILSTASLIAGVAAGGGDRVAIVLAGTAGLMAGAMSMAAGEYVSVSSQADTEAADTEREKYELEHNPDSELEELVAIYEFRGLSPDLARKVAVELTEKDALAAHLRDEIGITDLSPPAPVQAAVLRRRSRRAVVGGHVRAADGSGLVGGHRHDCGTCRPRGTRCSGRGRAEDAGRLACRGLGRSGHGRHIGHWRACGYDIVARVIPHFGTGNVSANGL
jgi:VIT1/CCC1 family predicted Fe2+/Mn2+ transporter